MEDFAIHTFFLTYPDSSGSLRCSELEKGVKSSVGVTMPLIITIINVFTV